MQDSFNENEEAFDRLLHVTVAQFAELQTASAGGENIWIQVARLYLLE